MTGYEMIDRINSMARCPVQYRANWLPAAEKQAKAVEVEIARLRDFAARKPGTIADVCRRSAEDLSLKLVEAMTKFQ